MSHLVRSKGSSSSLDGYLGTLLGGLGGGGVEENPESKSEAET